MKNNCQIIFNNEDIKNKIKNCDLIFIFFNDFLNYKEKKFFLFDFLKKNNHSFIEKKFHNIVENKIKNEKDEFNNINNNKLWIFRYLRDVNILIKIIENLKQKYTNIFWIKKEIFEIKTFHELSKIENIIKTIFNEHLGVIKIDSKYPKIIQNNKFNYLTKVKETLKVTTNLSNAENIAIGSGNDMYRILKFFENFRSLKNNNVFVLADNFKKIKSYNFELNSTIFKKIKKVNIKKLFYPNIFELIFNFFKIKFKIKKILFDQELFLTKNINLKLFEVNFKSIFIKNKLEIIRNFIIYKKIKNFLLINKPKNIFVCNNDGIYERIIEKISPRNFTLFSVPHGFMSTFENYDYYADKYLSENKFRSNFLKKYITINKDQIIHINLEFENNIKKYRYIDKNKISILNNGYGNFSFSNYYYPKKFENSWEILIKFIKERKNFFFNIVSHPNNNHDNYLEDLFKKNKVKNYELLPFLKKNNELSKSSLIIEFGNPSAASIYCLQNRLPIVFFTEFIKKISSSRKFIINNKLLTKFSTTSNLCRFIDKYHNNFKKNYRDLIDNNYSFSKKFILNDK